MTDLMLIAGSALCALSILAAIIAVAQTRAPRGAAILLMLGIIVLLVGAKMEPAAYTPENVMGAWKRLFAGEISLDAAPTAAPEASPAATAPEAASSGASTESGAGASAATPAPAATQ